MREMMDVVGGARTGEKHRLEGPSVINSNGDIFWVQNGKLHRLDGPAVIRSTGNKAWWIDNCTYTEEEFNEKVKELTK